MICDIFFSICQNEVNGEIPTEKTMWDNFFSQIRLADQLGFECAWIAESHLSSEAQKTNRKPVIPHFKGEMGLNTDIYQLAHLVYAQTEKIGVGSAIRNILCNGGPIAQAEALRTFLQLRNISGHENRWFSVGFAAGRFPYTIAPYGVCPQNGIEEKYWPLIQHQIFLEATEIFLRLVEGETLSSDHVTTRFITREHFKSEEEWQGAFKELGSVQGYVALENKIYIPHFYKFESLQIIPKDLKIEKLDVVIGSHTEESHQLANTIRPTKVFNLSITPADVLNRTHEKMKSVFHPEGGPWKREYMPRTTMVFIEDTGDVEIDRSEARKAATLAYENYWKAMDGTVDPEKVKRAVDNVLCGTPQDVLNQARERFDKDDRVMFWFDFSEHNSQVVEHRMKLFAEKVMPYL